MTDATIRFHAAELTEFACDTLEARGLPRQKARSVARILVEGDLLGHTTHGLALLPFYLDALEAGGMETQGDWEIIKDRPAAALWDGRLLPGPWLLEAGFRTGVERARAAGTFTLVIRDSHHTACLAAYLPPVAEAGMMAVLMVSDPTERSVAPFGGVEPLISTNPIAFGIPGDGGPLLVDISTSATANGMVTRLADAGRLFAHEWLQDAEGRPTRDPKVRRATPPGTILPLGGVGGGHKGFALGLATEGMTHGLSGAGRGTSPEGCRANVFLQVIDPDCFGGLAALRAEMGVLAEQARTSRPTDRSSPVRLPGDRALAERKRMLSEGVEVSPILAGRLADCADLLRVPLPAPLN